MGQLDASIVTIVYPSLKRESDASLAAVQWMSLAYLLVLTAALVTVGRRVRTRPESDRAGVLLRRPDNGRGHALRQQRRPGRAPRETAQRTAGTCWTDHRRCLTGEVRPPA
ncbi:hypothetical protein ACFWP5_29765 [Streptomyces sp. NPDC058469]|uniref:hypothetical protein n=1 Tax=Streptomyces sp. NPDC058469 TaxID=3346514 RepID=UPI00365F95B5